MAYQAEYTAYVKQKEAIRQEAMNLHTRVHHSLLDKTFRIDFEARYKDHATMDLEDYIEAVKGFYNLTISTLPSQRKHIAKREW